MSRCADITCALSISHYYVTRPGRVMTKSSDDIDVGMLCYYALYCFGFCLTLLLLQSIIVQHADLNIITRPG